MPGAVGFCLLRLLLRFRRSLSKKISAPARTHQGRCSQAVLFLGFSFTRNSSPHKSGIAGTLHGLHRQAVLVLGLPFVGSRLGRPGPDERECGRHGGVSAERVGSRWLRGLWTFYPCPLPCFCTMLDPWPGKRQVRNGGNVGVGVFLRVRYGFRGMVWARRDWCGCVVWGALGHLGALPGPFVLCLACCLPAVCVCWVFRTGSCVCCVCVWVTKVLKKYQNHWVPATMGCRHSAGTVMFWDTV